MKCMKRLLGIMMSVILVAGSVKAPAYAVETETGVTAAEAEIETDSIEGVEIAEGIEPDADFDKEEHVEEDSAVDVSKMEEDEIVEKVDSEQYTISEESSADVDIIEEDLEESEASVATMAVVASGVCGDNLTYQITGEGSNLTLTISGIGEMYDYATFHPDQHTVYSVGDLPLWVSDVEIRKNINHIIVEEGVTGIGAGAFSYIGSPEYGVRARIEEICLPQTLQRIGGYAFYFTGCDEITIGSPNNPVRFEYPNPRTQQTLYGKGLALSNFRNVSICMDDTYGSSFDHSTVENVVLLEGTTTIPGGCFNDCEELQSVELAKTVTQIDDFAFSGCHSLIMVDIPNGSSLEIINKYAFENCYSLKTITLPEGLNTIKQDAFENCTSLDSIDIPNSVTTIEFSVFSGCTSLTSVHLPEGLEIIDYLVFANCSNLTSISIPVSVTEIKDKAFYNCKNLTMIEIPAGVNAIAYEYSSKGGKLSAFAGADKLVEIKVSNGNTTYKSYDGCLYNSELTELLYCPEGKNKLTIAPSTTSIYAGALLVGDVSDSTLTSNIQEIYFGTSSPEIPDNTLRFLTATAYYNNLLNNWPADKRQNYGGTITWVEKPLNLSDCTVSISPNSYTYDGTAKKPTVTINYNGKTLTNDTDYIVSYSNNINAGTGTVTATGKGKFSETVSKTFTINKATPTLSFASSSVSKKITDSAFTNTLTKKTDGTVTFSSDDTSVAVVDSSTGEVTIKGIGNATITASAAEGANYTAGTTAYTLIVMPHNISLCTVTIPEESYLYAGQAIEPPLTVQRGTVTLVRGTDYMIVYTDNINAGTATITVAGIGNYAGTVQKTFSIAKAKPELTFASASISKKTTDSAFTNELTKKTDGTVTFMSSETGVATVNNTTGQVTIKGVGTTEITATAAEGTNYTTGSASYTLTVADASVLTLEDLTYNFANNAQTFGYPEVYKIPRSSYVIIFGDNTKASWFYKDQNTWKGNCMGFSSTAALLHDPDSDISPTDFHAGADRIFDLGVHDENTSIGINVTQFIEAMQISQKTTKVREAIVSNRVFTSEIRKGNKNLNGLYSSVKGQTDKGIPVVIAVLQDGGHAILAYKAEDVSSTEGRIYVYENNRPSEERYITLNRNSSGDYTSWSYDMGGYGIWGTSNSDSSISYIPYSVIAYVWEHRGNVRELENVVRFNSRNVALFDKDDEPVATIVKGKLFTDDSRIRIIEDDLEAGGSSDDGYTLLSMPIDVYTVKNLDSNTDSLDLSVVDTDLGASVETTAKEVTFVVDDSNDLNSILIHAEEGDNYSITLNSSFESDEHDEVKITGYGKGETMEVSREDGYISINNCQILNITVDGVEVSKYTISASAGEGGSITPSGESTVIRDMDASYSVTPDNGYVIEDVKVDGKSVGAVSSYTFSKVRAGHTISATFKKSLTLPGKTSRGDMFNLANNVKVTWKEVSGAKYYKVYREGITDPKETRMEPVIVTTGLVGWDKDPGLTNGHAYRYKIVASLTGKGDNSGDSKLSYSKVMYRLKTVVIRSVKNTEPGKVTVKYDKTTAGDSYVLQYSENQDMTGARTKVVLGANNTTYVIGGLKKGKTYYISIRVRKKVNGIDYYTTFGVPKKVMVTK